jgi:hypothetical protein
MDLTADALHASSTLVSQHLEAWSCGPVGSDRGFHPPAKPKESPSAYCATRRRTLLGFVYSKLTRDLVDAGGAAGHLHRQVRSG